MIDRLAAAIIRFVVAVAWLAVAVAISLGAAGVAAGIDHQPGTAARPELTWAGDSTVAPTHETAIVELATIAGLVDQLGVQGRGALAALTARDFELLDRTSDAGGTLVRTIGERSGALRAALLGLDGFNAAAAYAFSADTRARHARLLEALDSTDGLARSWARLAVGGLAAAQLSTLLAIHDERITSAIDVGRAGDFDEALARIGRATEALDAADRLRDQLANNVDVATLDEWLRRNREYDEALRALYVASAESPQRVTAAIRAALAAEAAAREQLPETTAGLTIIMADIGQGGLNQAVIVIEETRGRLAGALADLRRSDAGQPG